MFDLVQCTMPEYDHNIQQLISVKFVGTQEKTEGRLSNHKRKTANFTVGLTLLGL